jgi:signal transduction histidine kinase
VELKEVRVAELLQEVEAETVDVREQTGAVSVWRVEEGLPSLCTDPGKLKVVFKNLIGNAVKFTPHGSITVQAAAKGGGVEVSVTDTGIGIPAEALAAIFEPFHQVDGAAARQHSGVGLGLHIVKRLLELLGGTVTVESTVGQGSTFRVWLPKEHPSSSEVSSAAVR